MQTATDKVVSEALELPADARISLIDRILARLNFPTQPEIDRLWAEKAGRRVAEIDGGKVKLVPGEEVFAKIRPKYGRYIEETSHDMSAKNKNFSCQSRNSVVNPNGISIDCRPKTWIFCGIGKNQSAESVKQLFA